jgi:hypothetical protein
MSIKLIPAPHEEKFSAMVSEYLLKEGCLHLGLELPREVEIYFNDYAGGKRTYEELRRILIDGEVISANFEEGYRPLFKVLPELYKRCAEFSVHCYEEFERYNDWVFMRDELVLGLMISEDLDALEDLYEGLVEETAKRNEAVAERIGALAGSLGEDLHVVMGRLHAPDVARRLRERFEVKEVVLEDICVTPLDESIILRLKGFTFSGGERSEFLRRHRELAKEAEREGRGITDLLRDGEVKRKYLLRSYTALAAL